MKKKLFFTLAPVLILAACGGEDDARFVLRDPIRVESVATLPAETVANVLYPVEYKFTNIDSRVAEGLRFSNNFPPEFTVVTQENKPSCTGKTSLNANESCFISGSFQASTAGDYSFGSSVSYEGGRTLEWIVSTRVSAVSIVATEVSKLPENITINQGYPVEVQFRNTGSQPADSVTFSIPQNTNNFLKTDSNTCETLTSLAAGQSCTYKGTATVAAPGFHEYELLFSYNSGNMSESLKSTGSTTGSNVPIVGTLTKAAPSHTVIGEAYPVTFTFRNDSSSLNATGLTYIKSFPIGFRLTSDNCSSVLRSGESCGISGTFSPSTSNYSTNLVHIDVTANYSQGSPVVLKSDTQVTKFDEFNISLDSSNIGFDNRKEIFRFTDITRKDLENVNITSYQINGNPGFNAFLVKGDVQQAINPQFVSASSYIEESINDADVPRPELKDTAVLFTTNTKQKLQINFRAWRPRCVVNGQPAMRQLNDNTACQAGPERVIYASLDQATFNALPAGTHEMTIRLSNVFAINSGSDAGKDGDFSGMAIVNFTVTK